MKANEGLWVGALWSAAAPVQEQQASSKGENKAQTQSAAGMAEEVKLELA